MKRQKKISRAILLMILLSSSVTGYSQLLLSRNITINISNQKLDDVLEIISNKENFYFSYNSRIINKDTLVSANVSNRPIVEVLKQLLGDGFEFKESGNYIILRKAPLKLRLVTSAAETENKFYYISGHVVDDQTGEKIEGASLYEKDRLIIVNTNSNGFFRMRLKSRYQKATISVSKEFYKDTSVVLTPRFNQTITVTLVPLLTKEHTVIIGPDGYKAPESIDLEVPLNDSTSWLYRYVKADSEMVDKKTLTRWFVSSGQRLQSINLRNFFTARPWQVSLLPRLSTNGRLNSQVINNFSLNVLGGYSGGTRGFEIGGLFNIDKKDMGYVQVAGLSNLVGGDVTGVQVSGLNNTNLRDFVGVGVAGIVNYQHNNLTGIQLAGVYNHVGKHTKGIQVAGVANFTNRTIKGMQIAGVANISTRQTNGMQIAGLFNYTRKLRGVQIGLINVSDTSEGYSIGLINIVARGYHKLSISTNEVTDLNVAFKTGNRKFYSILLAGYNTPLEQQLLSFGYGLGSEIQMGKKLSLNVDLTSQYLYRGTWDYTNILNRINPALTFRITKFLSVFAGPSYTFFVSDQDLQIPGYKSTPPGGYNTHKFSDQVTGWIGWSAGVNIF